MVVIVNETRGSMRALRLARILDLIFGVSRNFVGEIKQPNETNSELKGTNY
jgi:hypothetical protein